MKKTSLKKLTAILCAAVMLSVTTGCSPDNSNDETTGSSSGVTEPEQSGETTTTFDFAGGDDMVLTTRALEEGDDFAINKINPKTEGETLPGGYVLREYTEEEQGKLYNNGKSKVVIRAYNYNEDLQDMAVWADNACAMMRVSNMLYACDTNFEKPENVKVCGFDGIKYDYEVIQYEILENEEDPDGDGIKSELYRMNARVYYFFSDSDAYAVTFDTRQEDWEEQVKNFEEFVADLEVTKVEY